MRKIGYVFLFLISCCITLSAWDRTYGGGTARDIIEVSSGGYLVLGESDWDVVAIRFDEDFDTLWSKKYIFDHQQKGWVIIECSMGGFLLGCSCLSDSTTLIKIDDAGNTLWTRSGPCDFFGGIESSPGEYILVGCETHFGGPNCCCINDAGDTLWTKRLTTDVFRGKRHRHTEMLEPTWVVNGLKDIIACSDSGYMVVGQDVSTGMDCVVFRLNSAMDTMWTKMPYLWIIMESQFESIKETPEGDFILAGWKAEGSVFRKPFLMKINSDGDSLWTRTFTTPDLRDVWPNDLIITSDSSYIMVGETDTGPGTHRYLFWASKTSDDGDSLWCVFYDQVDMADNDDTWGFSVLEVDTGCYASVGQRENYMWVNYFHDKKNLLITENLGRNDTLIGGEYFEFWWRAYSVPGSLTVEFSTDGESTWSVLTTEGFGHSGDTLPFVNSSECLYKITSNDDPQVYDIFNYYFTIKIASRIDLVSPVGGELWQVGETEYIVWDFDSVYNVDIDYSTDDGTTWINVETSYPCDGTYLWTIPNTPSTQCLVMVTNSGDLTVFDTSDSIFTITDDTLARSITILYPVGGELLTIGSDVSILWNSTNVDYIDIEYSTNFGADWVTEADSIVSTGIYTFTVPDDSSYDCLLKITDALDDSVYDISDGNFGFIPNAPYVRVVQPNGGEELLAGMAYDIIWTHYNIPDEFPEFTIYYSTNSGDSWEIEYVNYGDTCYNWTVPADTSLECLVKIEWFDSLTFYPSARRGLSPEDDDGTYFVDFSDMCFSIVSELGIRFGERFPDESILRTYPNPFNSSVSIYAPENANIEIFDINGRMVEKIPTSPLNNRSAERKKTGGSFIWSPDKSLGSGVYLVRAKIGDEKITKRVVYLK